jgi:hypothetical protein
MATRGLHRIDTYQRTAQSTISSSKCRPLNADIKSAPSSLPDILPKITRVCNIALNPISPF